MTIDPLGAEIFEFTEMLRPAIFNEPPAGRARRLPEGKVMSPSVFSISMFPKPPSSSSHQFDETAKVAPALKGISVGVPSTTLKSKGAALGELLVNTTFGAAGDWFRKTKLEPPVENLVSPWNLIWSVPWAAGRSCWRGPVIDWPRSSAARAIFGAVMDNVPAAAPST